MTFSATAIVIMGISGCGKSTLGAGLAEATGYRFVEGDDLHPAENIAKMSAGIALSDDDRWPWLERIAEVLSSAKAGDGCIVSCSALRYAYRHLLRTRSPEGLLFVFPHLPTDIVRARLRDRPNHYMPPSLIDSQVATLELPRPDEPVLTINGAADPSRCVDLVMSFLSTPQISPRHSLTHI
ncbi:carbohydrate kinase, thermoresistant glucokinase family protein [Asticcacaulis biprosthecium C19]|uniref:Gluconokinase n=1 Tax=Asticcacaulis biprosthecium C19 TaxID=715226 RepID=F4QIE5_9CAUL|nr:gluconokinase [Asticcacaulis biprosthecium]EGF92934.1 carbohydrate kinase, thermoresistant glucokinase family protein [Asticcacaulis biprosthecium C19]